MASPKKPGSNVGKQGGIYQEVGPKGGAKPTRDGGGQQAVTAHHETGTRMDASQEDAG